jgi:hypothetical protein
MTAATFSILIPPAGTARREDGLPPIARLVQSDDEPITDERQRLHTLDRGDVFQSRTLR